jgi:hypothetical protein
MQRQIVGALCLICTMFWLDMTAAAAQDAPPEPLAPLSHCRGVGPLPLNGPDFCGCTWGNVYYRGEPLEGVDVELHFAGGSTADTTSPDAVGGGVESPFFSVTGHNLGAKKGDVMTLTVSFAGDTITRSFRAWPAADGEQQVNLVLPPRGEWQRLLAMAGFARAMVYDGQQLWAGGDAGLIALDPTSGVSSTHTLPWPGAIVTGLAADGQGNLWVAAAEGVARRSGGNWEPYPPPFAGTPQTVAVDPASGAVWLGGGDADGKIAVFNTGWQTVYTTTHPVRALAVDSAGHLWAATWGGGVLRQAGPGQDPGMSWTNFRVADGIASDFAYAIVSDQNQVWLGTRPYLSGQGNKGGISRYDLGTGTWKNYGRAEGLPGDSALVDAPAHVYALAVDSRGVPWAGTGAGLYFMGSEGYWTRDGDQNDERTNTLAVAGAVLYAGRPAAIDRLSAGAQLQAPSVEMVSVSGHAVASGETLTLRATASGGPVFAWEWTSDRDGPLCTTPGECSLPVAELTPGTHTIRVRVQNGLGAWSQTGEASVVVGERRLYMTFLSR